MTDKRKLANQELTEFLKNFDFKKKGSNWVLSKKEFLLLIDLQKSQWSDIYYVNVGIQFSNLNESLPKAHRGDIKYRVSSKLEGGKTKGDFDLEKDLSLIKELITEQIIGVFVNLETKEEVKDIILKNVGRYIVTVNGKRILGIE